MEWWKLFSSTFILIFLAELGDKTQLAALAKTADSPGGSAKWIVFLGASLALVASTFIAVFLGQAFKSLIPDERYIKIAAATLFLIFGFMILYETVLSFRGEKTPEAAAAADEAAAASGLIGGIALRAAKDFEQFAGERYRRLAASAPPRLAAVLREIAKEEDSHLSRLRGVPEPEQVPGVDANIAASCELMPKEMEVGALRELIRHEETTAAFYQALADKTVIPSLRSIFGKLAEEERGHARRLAAMGASVRLFVDRDESRS